MQRNTDKQSTFDFVATKLIEQQVPAAVLNEHGKPERCAYRGPNNTKCAAGHLVPDELYSREFEGRSVIYGRIRDIIENQGHDLLLVAELQNAHDHAAFGWLPNQSYADDDEPDYLKRLKNNLRLVAERHKLSTVVLDSPAWNNTPTEELPVQE